MKNGTFFLFFLAVAMSWNTAFGEEHFSESPPGAKAYIISPKDGEVVGKSFTVRFGLVNMGVAPAGVKLPNTGHHHLLVDLEESSRHGKTSCFQRERKAFRRRTDGNGNNPCSRQAYTAVAAG